MGWSVRNEIVAAAAPSLSNIKAYTAVGARRRNNESKRGCGPSAVDNNGAGLYTMPSVLSTSVVFFVYKVFEKERMHFERMLKQVEAGGGVPFDPWFLPYHDIDVTQYSAWLRPQI